MPQISMPQKVRVVPAVSRHLSDTNSSFWIIHQLQCLERRKRRTTPLQKCHGVEFGFRVTETDAQMNMLRNVVCWFCEIIWREPKPVMKWQPAKNAQYYKPPFRPELYRKLNDTQHQTKWKEYRGLPVVEKDTFFDGTEGVKKTLHTHFTQNSMAMVFELDKDVIESIIGDIHFNVDDEEDSGNDNDDSSDFRQLTPPMQMWRCTRLHWRRQLFSRGSNG